MLAARRGNASERPASRGHPPVLRLLFPRVASAQRRSSSARKPSASGGRSRTEGCGWAAESGSLVRIFPFSAETEALAVEPKRQMRCAARRGWLQGRASEAPMLWDTNTHSRSLPSSRPGASSKPCGRSERGESRKTTSTPFCPRQMQCPL